MNKEILVSWLRREYSLRRPSLSMRPGWLGAVDGRFDERLILAIGSRLYSPAWVVAQEVLDGWAGIHYGPALIRVVHGWE